MKNEIDRLNQNKSRTKELMAWAISIGAVAVIGVLGTKAIEARGNSYDQEILNRHPENEEVCYITVPTAPEGTIGDAQYYFKSASETRGAGSKIGLVSDADKLGRYAICMDPQTHEKRVVPAENVPKDQIDYDKSDFSDGDS